MIIVNETAYFVIWGAQCEDLADAQVVWEQWATRAMAEAKCEALNDADHNHPDLSFWLEATTEEDCGYCGSSQDPNVICKSCWNDMQGHVPPAPDPDAPKHTSMCEQYWDRGLECRCIPADVQRAMRAGANPEDVM